MKTSSCFALLIFFILHAFSVQALPSLRLVKRGDKSYNEFAYKEALIYYQAAYKKDSNSVYLTEQIASCYLKLNNSIKAEYWLRKCIAKDTVSNQTFYLLLADQLSKNKNYAEAASYYSRVDDIPEARRKLDGMGKFKAESDAYTIVPIDVNSSQNDFSPFYLKQGIGFISSRAKPGWLLSKFRWDDTEYLDIYYSNTLDYLNSINKIDRLNSPYHDGPACVYANGNNIIFTRSSKIKDSQGITKLQLFVSEKDEEGFWKTPIPFIIGNPEYAYGHPTMSPNGDSLIFVSDMPGGYGGTDLYFTYKMDTTSWSDPINLGEAINTTGNELFPYYKDKILIFSSDGRAGLGGLDIYYTTLEMGLPTEKEPTHLMAPLNSAQDDFGLITQDGIHSGYFSSNREGQDNIYTFEANYATFKGSVFNYRDSLPLSDTEVTLYDFKGKIITTTTTNKRGNYEIKVLKTSGVEVRAQKSTYQPINSLKISQINQPNYLLDPLWLWQPLIELEVIDEKSKKPLEEALVQITDLNSGQILTPIEKNKKYVIDTTQRYTIQVARQGYFTYQDILEAKANGREVFRKKIELKKIVVGQSIRLNNIYYAPNSHDLNLQAQLELDRLYLLLNDNPKMRIELSSHTDAVGSARYNMTLSQKRAEVAAEYLIGKGIAKSRIIPKGYGESILLNRCKDGVKCDDIEHQLNRRTEIKLIAVK